MLPSGAQPLPCGMAKAKYYLFSGGVFTGEKAERIAKNSIVGVQWSKKALNRWLQLASPTVEQSVALAMLTFLPSFIPMPPRVCVRAPSAVHPWSRAR
jgi:hypothetical protein